MYLRNIVGLTMQDTTPHHKPCGHCTFAPFCIPEEDNTQWMNHVNLAVKQYHHLKPKEALCLPNNKFRNLYVVQQGALKTYQVDAAGNELIRGFYFAGELFGIEAIFKNHYLSAAVALSETVICEIPYDNFLQLLQPRPELQKHILYVASQQLNTGAYLIATTAEQRLAAFLIDVSTRLNPDKMQLELLLPMTRQEIGNYLRLTAETISRLFSRLQKDKIIISKHKKIHLLQLDTLQQIADGLDCVIRR